MPDRAGIFGLLVLRWASFEGGDSKIWSSRNHWHLLHSLTFLVLWGPNGDIPSPITIRSTGTHYGYRATILQE